MKPYTYLIIEFLTIFFCFIFSFDRRIQFHKHFLSFFKAAFLVAIPFWIWDIWFTKTGVWWFNTDYTINSVFAGLPLEEWLFFLFIPFSCIFTFYCLEKFFRLDFTTKFNLPIAIITLIVTATVAIVFYQKAYPCLTATSAFVSVFYLQFIAKVNWLGKASLAFFILMLGFLPVNGVLTGFGLDSPIVNYNSNEILNLRIVTIPIEDSVYGYTQFILIWYFFNIFRKQKQSN